MWIAPRAGAFGAVAVAGDVACPGAGLFGAGPSGGAVAVAAVTGAVAADTVAVAASSFRSKLQQNKIKK